MLRISRFVSSFSSSLYFTSRIKTIHPHSMNTTNKKASEFAKKVLKEHRYKINFENLKVDAGCLKSSKVFSFEDYVDKAKHLNNVSEALKVKKMLHPNVTESQIEYFYALAALSSYRRYLTREACGEKNDPGLMITEDFFKDES